MEQLFIAVCGLSSVLCCPTETECILWSLVLSTQSHWHLMPYLRPHCAFYWLAVDICDYSFLPAISDFPQSSQGGQKNFSCSFSLFRGWERPELWGLGSFLRLSLHGIALSQFLMSLYHNSIRGLLFEAQPLPGFSPESEAHVLLFSLFILTKNIQKFLLFPIILYPEAESTLGQVGSVYLLRYL